MTGTGRFAPSPTGELHFGSLIAAVASYLQAKSTGKQWLVRIEDLDPPREVPGSARRILRDLRQFGMQSDQPVLYQSTRNEAYENSISQLVESNQAYWCGCSRSDLPASGIYPGTCAAGLPSGKAPRSVRIRVRDETIEVTDRIQGPIRENLAKSVGDFVIRRADGLAAYQLAVVVDDAYQGVTEVVRGADLLDSTIRQIYLQNCLELPTPDYAHHPVATTADGKKLSKRLGSDPITGASPAETLTMALRFLGHHCPPKLNLEETWRWALGHWQLSRIPRTAFTL